MTLSGHGRNVFMLRTNLINGEPSRPSQYLNRYPHCDIRGACQKTNTRWHSWPTPEENNYSSIWLSKSRTVQRHDSHRARRRPQQGHHRRTRLQRVVNLHCFPSMSAMQQVLSATFRHETHVLSNQPECGPEMGSWRRSKQTQAMRTMGTTSVRDAAMMTSKETKDVRRGYGRHCPARGHRCVGNAGSFEMHEPLWRLPTKSDSESCSGSHAAA